MTHKIGWIKGWLNKRTFKMHPDQMYNMRYALI